MPWSPSDAHAHNHAARGHAARQWAAVANAVRKRTGNDGQAIREANGVIARAYGGGIPGMAGAPVPRFDAGGSTPDIGGIVPTAATQNPQTQNLVQRFSAMSPEQLQEMSLRLGAASQQGQIAAKVLQQKRLQPTQGQPAQPAAATTASGPTSAAQGLMGYSEGGGLGLPPSSLRRPLQASSTSGFLHSTIPGRTDHIPATPAANSFVVPADVESGIGEGNSTAGAAMLDHVFHTGPHGIPMPAAPHVMGMVKPPAAPRAKGGDTDAVPILAAGGEFIIRPEAVVRTGGGDVRKGHRVLEAWVVHERKKIINTMKKLPGPVKS